MAQHVLSLEAPDTMNPCILRVVDTSVYNQDTPVECPILEITLPGFTSGCGTTFNNLPDGIYILKWSVSPNDKVYAEYNHLRITKALIMYNEALCELDLGTCEPGSETEKKLDTLRKIRMYLDAAKAKVEVCHEPRKGLELYKYAVKLLNKFECKSCQNY
jgi:hypothetical protein